MRVNCEKCGWEIHGNSSIASLLHLPLRLHSVQYYTNPESVVPIVKHILACSMCFMGEPVHKDRVLAYNPLSVDEEAHCFIEGHEQLFSRLDTRILSPRPFRPESTRQYHARYSGVVSTDVVEEFLGTRNTVGGTQHYGLSIYPDPALRSQRLQAHLDDLQSSEVIEEEISQGPNQNPMRMEPLTRFPNGSRRAPEE